VPYIERELLQCVRATLILFGSANEQAQRSVIVNQVLAVRRRFDYSPEGSQSLFSELGLQTLSAGG